LLEGFGEDPADGGQGGLAGEAGGAVIERLPAWIWASQFERRPLVTWSNIRSSGIA